MLFSCCLVRQWSSVKLICAALDVRAANGGGEEAAEEVEADWESGNKNQSYPRGEIKGTGTLYLPSFKIDVLCVYDPCDIVTS